jgi:hypothetical protein
MATTPSIDAGPLIALSEAHRLEVSLLQTRIERLTAVLREHGLPIPGDDPRLGLSDGEHLLACREVVIAAYTLLERLDDLKLLVGSGMELLDEKGWVE